MTEDALRALNREECLRLLGQHRLGRIATHVEALPAILPVWYSLLDDDIVLRASRNSRLGTSLIGAVVGFEVDHVSEDDQSGWSVLAVGRVDAIVDPTQAAHQFLSSNLPSWGSSDDHHLISIGTGLLSGRAFGAFHL
jgi:nitroimidazol reductase NimA-like FMN-containing flavoprotein (pyridoxamine 5'-phosphate oxidase superfamily)